MNQSIVLLKEHYLKKIQKNPSLLIGVELEFPVVEKSGKATNIQVTKQLLQLLSESFTVEKYDRDHNPIQLLDPVSGDRILFEVSYTTLEFAFAPVQSIHEVAERFERYLSMIQEILAISNHEIQGWGVHPNWARNDNSPVKSPRYEMLMAYLALAQNHEAPGLHHFYDYGSFICGSQVQLDVSQDNYLRVINAFNQLEPVKAFLFANSDFWGQDWDTKIARDIFWEASMHGIFEENVGVNPHDFQSEDDFFTYLSQSAIFTAEREGQTYYFAPIQVREYLDLPEIPAYDLAGNRVFLQPSEKDFETHRSYQYQDLTTRGTVEFRSVCTQPLERTFAPAAFHLGLLVELEELESYLAHAPFFAEYGRDYPYLRRRFSQKRLSLEEADAIWEFARGILQICQKGLEKRGFGEESYLAPLLVEK